METKDWLVVLRDGASLNCKDVQFIGGEPTLHPDLPELISFAAEHGYTFIEVYTNATAISPALLNVFVDCRVSVALSFYSDDACTHDTITKRPGSFSRTLANIKRLVKKGIPIRAGVVETPLNKGHVRAAAALLNQLGISEIRVDRQRAIGRGAQELHQLNPMKELCGECWNGKLCISSEGNAYPCVFSRFAKLGNIKDGLGGIVRGDSLSQFRTSLRTFRTKPQNDSVSERSCGPDVVCNPDLSCGPNCSPNSSTCGPAQFCVPSRMCAPDQYCGPLTGPCQPSTRQITSDNLDH
jgi:MoaA/NifB/PqqE/SkfB family radical SAM enzyme